MRRKLGCIFCSHHKTLPWLCSHFFGTLILPCLPLLLLYICKNCDPSTQDFTKFNILKPKLLETVDAMLAEDIARLMALIPLEDENHQPGNILCQHCIHRLQELGLQYIEL